MPSQVDFAIAVGLFIVFIAVLLLYLTGYMSSFTGLISTSELRTAVYNLFNILFGGKGVPEDWEEYNRTPVVAGLITDLIKVPITVSEEYGRGFTNLLVAVENLKLENHVWNSTIRIYDEDGNEVKYDFDEIYYDSDGNIREMSLSFLTNLTALQTKTFFIYGSQEKAIQFKNYTVNPWWNSSYRYRKPIVLVENLGVNRNNELTSKHIVFDKDCEYRVVDKNIALVDDNNQSISYSLNNTVYCAGSYLKEADVWFNATISANNHTVYWVYYNPLIPIFEDGFESGDFSAWDGTTTSTGETADVVITDPHHGIYHAKFTCDGSSTGETSVANKILSSAQQIVYTRIYYKVLNSLPATNRVYSFLNYKPEFVAMARIFNDAGTMKWNLYYLKDGSAVSISTPSTINLDTWYSLELYTKVHSTEGAVALYVNGIKVLNDSGFDNDDYGNIDRVRVGERYSTGATAHEVYVDDVVVADTYIGP